mgnify:CR=1 FL=1
MRPARVITILRRVKRKLHKARKRDGALPGNLIRNDLHQSIAGLLLIAIQMWDLC